MAAGDVSVLMTGGRQFRGKRMVVGTVQLDGANPTPVALAAYLSAIEGFQLTREGTAAPGTDPHQVTGAISGTTLNVYAWKPTGTADTALVASTNNAVVVHFIAWGKA